MSRKRKNWFFFLSSFLRCLVRKGRCEAELCDSRNEIMTWLRAFSSFPSLIDQWKKETCSLAFNEQIVWHLLIYLYLGRGEKTTCRINNRSNSFFLLLLSVINYIFDVCMTTQSDFEIKQSFLYDQLNINIIFNLRILMENRLVWYYRAGVWWCWLI